jgi:hypothetical protein
MSFGGNNVPASVVGLITQAANISGLNNWNLQEASYNGAQFHWMQPAYNGIDPVAGIISYIESGFGGSQKPNYGTWSNVVNMQDQATRKLVVFPVPNYNGFYIDDFGNNGVSITVYGLIYGPSYQEVLEKCQAAFLDVELFPGSGGSNNGQPIGVSTGDNFRNLVHPIYGLIKNVYYAGFTLIHSSDRWRAAAFQLNLIAQNPDYLTTIPQIPAWEQEAQDILNAALTLLISITQAFTLAQSIADNVSSVSLSVRESFQDLSPVINSTGYYIQAITQEITERLETLKDTYTNSMAFLVQNTGGAVQSAYWDAVVIDTSTLPVYLIAGSVFTAPDADAVIVAYVSQVNDFITYAVQNGYELSLANNISALKNSVVSLNQFATTFLAQSRTNTVIQTPIQTNLRVAMFNNDISLSKFDEVNNLNRGQWFSGLRIPAGTNVIYS